MEIRTRTFADPEYLAETLTNGVHAADLKGWRATDARGVQEWLLDGLDSRPMEHMVRGQNRSGFLLLEVTRAPHSRTDIDVELRVTLTDTGSPLDENGEPIRR